MGRHLIRSWVWCSLAAVTLTGLVWTPALARAGEPAIPAKVRPPGVTTELGNDRLSDEVRISRWAYANAAVPFRTRPSADARRFGQLRFLTEDGVAEVHLVLSSTLDESGRVWLKVRIPGRPNGRTGWVRQETLGDLNVVTTYLRVEKKAARATLFRSGRKIWSSRIGHGAVDTPTPSGRFYVREKLRNLANDPLYGPFAFGTSAYSVLSDWPGGGVVGIHGTDQPWLIPGRPSHGCIRVPNEKIKKLAKLMPVGTPIRIF